MDALQRQGYVQAPWGAAIAAAVEQIESQDKDVRVLDIGAGAGRISSMQGWVAACKFCLVHAVVTVIGE